MQFHSCASPLVFYSMSPSDVIVSAGAEARPQCDKDNFSKESQPLQSRMQLQLWPLSAGGTGCRSCPVLLAEYSAPLSIANGFEPFAFKRQFLTTA